jgi:hypothetical protein
MNITIADTIVKGMNNPDCAFFVGATVGNILTIKIVMWIALVYFALRLTEKLFFIGVPKLYKRFFK